ncbi:MAG: hypothetical protein ACK5V3_17400 [Bdellovibrionales bacterium]
MKSVLVLTLFFGLSAQAIMAPVGEYTSISCKSTDSKNLKVYIKRNTKKPKSVLIEIVNSDGLATAYKAKDVSTGSVGGSTVLQAPVMAGMLTFSVNFTTAPRPGGGRPGLLTSQAYGHIVKTPLMCSRVMY